MTDSTKKRLHSLNANDLIAQIEADDSDAIRRRALAASRSRSLAGLWSLALAIERVHRERLHLEWGYRYTLWWARDEFKGELARDKSSISKLRIAAETLRQASPNKRTALLRQSPYDLYDEVRVGDDRESQEFISSLRTLTRKLREGNLPFHRSTLKKDLERLHTELQKALASIEHRPE